jgi:ABC-2 type transport system permease protein
MALNSIIAFIELEMRRLRTNRMELYTRVVQPILWLALFGPIISQTRAIEIPGVNYESFIMPGILIQSIVFVSIFYGLTIIWESESGILKKLLTIPISRESIIIGRSSASIARALFQMAIIIPVSYLVGVRVDLNPLFILLSIFIVFLTSMGFSSLSIFIASFMRTRERFMGLGQAITLPLFFASNALYPINVMPPIIREIASFNPLSYSVDSLRDLLILGNFNILNDVIFLLLFNFACIFLASIRFNKIAE